MPTVNYSIGSVYDSQNAIGFNIVGSVYSGPSATYRVSVDGSYYNTENIAEETRFGRKIPQFINQGTSFSVDFSDNSGPVTLNGYTYGDVLRGGSGNDTLNGGEGNDILEGGAGADTFIGGNGIDTVSYEDSTGSVIASLNGSAAFGDALGDSFSGIENLRGTAFGDVLFGDFGENVIEGGGGADQIYGSGQNDTASYANSQAGVTVNLKLVGNFREAQVSAGDASGDELSDINHLLGSAFADILTGDFQANILTGAGGGDTLNGDDGNDTLIGGVGADTLNGGNGIDTASYATSTVAVTVNLAASAQTGGDVAGDTFNSIENLTGSAYNDSLTGDGGANGLDGGAGNDTLDGGRGADTLIGGAGNDRYIVDNAADQVVEAAGGGTDTVFARASYVLAAGQEIETLGTISVANTAAINLTGNEVIQTLSGNAGANVLDGKGGYDVLAGLGGADTFVFSTALGSDNIDRIADFTSADDTIRLDGAIFTALGGGALDASAFKDLSLGAADADDRILYDHNKGRLYYDADGRGGEAAVQFAILSGKPDLSYDDFFVG